MPSSLNTAGRVVRPLIFYAFGLLFTFVVSCTGSLYGTALASDEFGNTLPFIDELRSILGEFGARPSFRSTTPHRALSSVPAQAASLPITTPSTRDPGQPEAATGGAAKDSETPVPAQAASLPITTPSTRDPGQPEAATGGAAKDSETSEGRQAETVADDADVSLANEMADPDKRVTKDLQMAANGDQFSGDDCAIAAEISTAPAAHVAVIVPPDIGDIPGLVELLALIGAINGADIVIVIGADD